MVVVCDDGDRSPATCRERVEQCGAVRTTRHPDRPPPGGDGIDRSEETGVHACIVTGIG
jgi:hypothetical protein